MLLKNRIDHVEISLPSIIFLFINQLSFQILMHYTMEQKSSVHGRYATFSQQSYVCNISHLHSQPTA